MSRLAEVLERLTTTIEARKGADPATSWTARLLADEALIGEKVLEEAAEVVEASDRDHLAAESADLIYHWLVLLAARGVSLDEVAAKLQAREGTSGIAEKAAR